MLALVIFDQLDSTRTLVGVFSGLLIAVSFGLLRDQWRREKLLSRIEGLVAGFESEKAWEALDVDCAWSIESADGSRASACTKRTLRFVRDEVLTIYEFSQSAGKTTSPITKGAFGDEAERALPVLCEDFPGPLGRMYRIISLEGVRRRGDQLKIQSDRVLENSFLEDRESVSFTPEVPTDRLALSVTWPKDRNPTGVWIEREGERQHVIRDVKENSEGRVTYRCEFSSPSLGEPIAIAWDWTSLTNEGAGAGSGAQGGNRSRRGKVKP
ncbi:MAG TPA: hypothetical protein VL988_11950 [Solirubrobacteraceae bacterium]|nr:hypothetical protein [Solirubrobacteraceae bacterium]